MSNPIHIVVPNGATPMATKYGSVQLNKNIHLFKVLLIPKFTCNLISIPQLTRDILCHISCTIDTCFIQDPVKKRTNGMGKFHGGLFYFIDMARGDEGKVAVVQVDKTTQ